MKLLSCCQETLAELLDRCSYIRDFSDLKQRCVEALKARNFTNQKNNTVVVQYFHIQYKPVVVSVQSAGVRMALVFARSALTITAVERITASLSSTKIYCLIACVNNLPTLVLSK